MRKGPPSAGDSGEGHDGDGVLEDIEDCSTLDVRVVNVLDRLTVDSCVVLDDNGDVEQSKQLIS